MTSTTPTRIALATTLAAGASVAPAHASTTATVADASAALSFWITWDLVYLGIGAVLLAVAVAIAVHEQREWSSLLRWTAKHDRATGDGDGAEGNSRRAA